MEAIDNVLPTVTAKIWTIPLVSVAFAKARTVHNCLTLHQLSTRFVSFSGRNVGGVLDVSSAHELAQMPK
jgi:hypothetical protein